MTTAKSDRKPLPGKFVWFELVTRDAKQAQAFYGELLGWKTQGFPMGTDTYEMICTGDSLDTMIGGYTAPTDARQPAHWISYLSVEDVDAATKIAVASGGKVIEAPADIPTVGRSARIADPLGAQLCLFKNVDGDRADKPTAVQGQWIWNELHTSDPAKVLPFYEKVGGYSVRSMSMGPDGDYHILSRDGADRAGVTAMLPPGVAPHWLPYAEVNDADATLARAQKHGGKVPMGPFDIPGIGRFGVVLDPAGAAMAVMKSAPRTKKD
jgi:uncharacterized protein